MATYSQLVKHAERTRIRITDQQRRQIYKIYKDTAKEYGRKVAKAGGVNLKTYDFYKYANDLKDQSVYMYSVIQNTIQTGMLNTSSAVTNAQSQFWGSIDPAIMDRVRDHLSDIPQHVSNEILSGGLYKDGAGLSQRIWRARNAYEKDIDYIINQGILAKKSAYELAKDLEVYLNPSARRPWDWSKVYPGVQKTVDYNAQSLARTSVTHAYQMAFVRSTRDNPFIVKYQWHASNSSRVCPICLDRDGRYYDKYDVPLDHPNGMCTISAVIEKSYDDIADEIADWQNGKPNPDLDKWLS